jgi:hypothetical protein
LPIRTAQSDFSSPATTSVVTAEGSLLRELTLDPSRDYQPLGARKLFRDVVRQASTMS